VLADFKGMILRIVHWKCEHFFFFIYFKNSPTVIFPMECRIMFIIIIVYEVSVKSSGRLRLMSIPTFKKLLCIPKVPRLVTLCFQSATKDNPCSLKVATAGGTKPELESLLL